MCARAHGYMCVCNKGREMMDYLISGTEAIHSTFGSKIR